MPTLPAPKERPTLPQDCGFTTTRYFINLQRWQAAGREWPKQQTKHSRNETELIYL